MSGTSADGVDAALVEIDPVALFAPRRGPASRLGAVRLLAYREEPYSDELRQAILRLASPEETRVDDVCRWNFALGEVFAEAALALLAEAGVASEEVEVIGSHGQTVYHVPEAERVGPYVTRSTLQLGEPAVIAERTGITTVANFRARDLAAGGQGAPLVAFFDRLLFFDPERVIVLQNLGGIGNATCLPGPLGEESTFAFDTGPGNMVIDGVVARLTGGRERCDRDGRWAAAGKPDRELVARLLDDPFFRAPPPKTTGREHFGSTFVDRLLVMARQRGLTPADVVATATLFTAASIADQYRRWILPRTGGKVDAVYLSGGGSYNPTLVQMIRDEVGRLWPSPDASGLVVDVGPAECRGGWPAAAKEAVAFAVLAVATLLGVPNNLPAATGATHPVVLGTIVPGRPGKGGRLGGPGPVRAARARPATG